MAHVANSIEAQVRRFSFINIININISIYSKHKYFTDFIYYYYFDIGVQVYVE